MTASKKTRSFLIFVTSFEHNSFVSRLSIPSEIASRSHDVSRITSEWSGLAGTRLVRSDGARHDQREPCHEVHLTSQRWDLRRLFGALSPPTNGGWRPGKFLGRRATIHNPRSHRRDDASQSKSTPKEGAGHKERSPVMTSEMQSPTVQGRACEFRDSAKI